MGKHTEAIIVAVISITLLGVYHFVYVPQRISQAKQEQSSMDKTKIDKLNKEISSLKLEKAESKSETVKPQVQKAPQYPPSYSYDSDDFDDEIDDLNNKLDEQEQELQNLKDKYNDAEESRYQKELDEWLDDKRDLPPQSPDYEL